VLQEIERQSLTSKDAAQRSHNLADNGALRNQFPLPSDRRDPEACAELGEDCFDYGHSTEATGLSHHDRRSAGRPRRHDRKCGAIPLAQILAQPRANRFAEDQKRNVAVGCNQGTAPQHSHHSLQITLSRFPG